MASPAEIAEYREWFDLQLNKTMEFWMSHSLDHKHGGYFNCLGITGDIYDRTKYGWMQGRQVWMFAKLYNEVSLYHRPDVLDAAIKGGEFLLDSVKVKGEMRCYFAVTEDGRPVQLQRKPYTECFYVMGLAELYRATLETKYQIAAEEMLQQLIHWICIDDSGLGRPKHAGTPPTRELGRPMILLNVISEFCGKNETLRAKYMNQIQWSIENMLLHHDGSWIHEHISLLGGYPEGCIGRLSTPGHAIEGGWFLLQEATIRGDQTLIETAIRQFIEIPWSYGWDKEFGGFYYFLDSDGHSPIQLEWNMKLFWPHCEALIAALMAYKTSRDTKHWLMFKQVFDYTLSHFPDNENGEWFGYLNREGLINQTFKGGPYKGCFHVPRCLLLCRQLLQELHA